MGKNQQYLDKLRHSAAHLLAAAILQAYPKAKLAIGPSIKNGFYYDIDFGKEKISVKNFPKIQKTMRQILKTWDKFETEKITADKAKKLFSDNPYKLELIDEFVKDKKKITIVTAGEFTDLCRGGHTDNPKKELKNFKLTKIAGAYWRGSEKNKMLTRIYGTVFKTKEELKKYLHQVEKAKKRDHRKIGKTLDLFTFSDLVGPGLPLYTPKGTIIINELYKALLEISKKYGVQETRIPHFAKRKLYELSGHAQKFEKELFTVKSHYNVEFVLKPVNCPHHTQIYASRPRSYKDLPIRYIESTAQHRDEKPGEIGGLTRTRSFIVDDGHTFCTVDHIKKEAINTCKIIEEFYKALGLWRNHWVSLSIRDPKNPDKYIGFEKDWKKAEKMIQEVNDELNLNGKIMEGEAAIYGPKIDYMFEDVLGNERQLATVQIDFAMPKRFKLTYTSEKGRNKTPVMLHRAILGSYERFITILIEHYAGAFPLWLSPVQVKILPLSEKNLNYANNIYKKILDENIRVELNDKDEPLGAKIRNAQLEKVPYMIILGDREMRNKKISVRDRSGKTTDLLELNEFINNLHSQISSKIN